MYFIPVGKCPIKYGFNVNYSDSLKYIFKRFSKGFFFSKNVYYMTCTSVCLLRFSGQRDPVPRGPHPNQPQVLDSCMCCGSLCFCDRGPCKISVLLYMIASLFCFLSHTLNSEVGKWFITWGILSVGMHIIYVYTSPPSPPHSLLICSLINFYTSTHKDIRGLHSVSFWVSRWKSLKWKYFCVKDASLNLHSCIFYEFTHTIFYN